MNPRLWWYVARAAGLVSWVLLAMAVISGLARSSRLASRPRPAWTLDLHRFLGGLSLVFVGVHMAGLALDTKVPFGLSDLLVPFASRWNPGAVAWGVVAFYLLVAVEITSLLMRRIPKRIWRGVHMSSFLLFAFGTIHMLTAGTDRSSARLQWAVLGVSGVVIGLAAFRVLARGERRRPRPVDGRTSLSPRPGGGSRSGAGPSPAAPTPAASRTRGTGRRPAPDRQPAGVSSAPSASSTAASSAGSADS